MCVVQAVRVCSGAESTDGAVPEGFSLPGHGVPLHPGRGKGQRSCDVPPSATQIIGCLPLRRVVNVSILNQDSEMSIGLSLLLRYTSP